MLQIGIALTQCALDIDSGQAAALAIVKIKSNLKPPIAAAIFGINADYRCGKSRGIHPLANSAMPFQAPPAAAQKWDRTAQKV